ncbi:MAG: metallophosphoesterase [Sodaliphilus sp.]
MKLQYASDMHLEFPDNTQWWQENPLAVEGDILVLSGDMLIFGNELMENHPFFDWCSNHYRHTFLVPGNHEYYNGVDITTTLHDFHYPVRHNVAYCNNRSIVLGNVELFFTTLWTIIPPESELQVQRFMTDCYRIQYADQTLLPRHFNALHQASVQWLSRALAASKAKAKVVVTHHCPVRVEDPAYASNGLTPAFIVAMEEFIANSDVAHWVFGHTHYNRADGMRVGNCTMHTNQMGYVQHGVCSGFRPDAVFKV